MSTLVASLILLGALDDRYVSPSGNDDQDGRSPQMAWRSVAKVNAAALLPATDRAGRMRSTPATLGAFEPGP